MKEPIHLIEFVFQSNCRSSFHVLISASLFAVTRGATSGSLRICFGSKCTVLLYFFKEFSLDFTNQEQDLFTRIHTR